MFLACATGSVHLYFHPEWPDIKLAQAALLCSEATKLITAEGLTPSEVPLILGGDWNSLWRKYRPDKFDQQVTSPYCTHFQPFDPQCHNTKKPVQLTYLQVTCLASLHDHHDTTTSEQQATWVRAAFA